MTADAPNSPSGKRSPPQVPDLDLVRLVGEGGFGQVWLATNRTTGQLRAVKVIPLHRSESVDPAGREITSITRLEANLRRRHPNLLALDHVGKTSEHLFYTMAPADDASGSTASLEPDYRPATLRRRLDSGPLEPEPCLEFARQLLAGLASLHEAGMVHRDVKPANCLFVDGQLKLADFGLLTEASPQVSRLGTRKYMPPDGRMDFGADVYAAGLVIYEMMTGLPAESFPRLGVRAATIAADPKLAVLNRLVLRACQPEPGERFRDGRRMLAELETIERMTADSPPQTRRRLIGWAASSVTILTVAALLTFFIFRPTPPPPPPPVHVNFITDPYEATIRLDGQPLVDPDGTPYRTPCSVPQLPARPHHVVFHHPQLGPLDAGRVDFATTREIVHRWESAPP